MNDPMTSTMTEAQTAAVTTLREVFDDHDLEWKEIEDGVFTVVLPG